MDKRFAAGREFILRQGRLLERRMFATCFEGASVLGVIDALRGYRNDDGGFGHGLEPDKRCPASLPIDVEVALQALATAGTVDQQLAVSACDYLAMVAAEMDRGGAVPLAFPVTEAYPRAEHWTGWTYEPALNPTAGLVGLLRQPLSVAPAADSRWRVLFGDDVLEAHLDRLQRNQQPDGGWLIRWDPPSDASRLEWRGIVTLEALRTLVSYGRLSAPR